MKQKTILLIMLILLSGLISSVSGQETGCPGREFAEVEVKFSFNPKITGIVLDIGPSCAPNSPLEFGIRNEQNDDVLVYVDGKGIEHDIWPSQSSKEVSYDESLPLCKSPNLCIHELTCKGANAKIIEGYKCFRNQVCCDFENADNLKEWFWKTYYKDEDIPQEIGAEWTRELYFKNNPNNKIIFSAKNIPRRKGVLQELNEGYTSYYVLGVIILIIFFVLIILKSRKK